MKDLSDNFWLPHKINYKSVKLVYSTDFVFFSKVKNLNQNESVFNKPDYNSNNSIFIID